MLCSYTRDGTPYLHYENQKNTTEHQRCSVRLQNTYRRRNDIWWGDSCLFVRPCDQSFLIRSPFLPCAYSRRVMLYPRYYQPCHCPVKSSSDRGIRRIRSYKSLYRQEGDGDWSLSCFNRYFNLSDIHTVHFFALSYRQTRWGLLDFRHFLYFNDKMYQEKNRLKVFEIWGDFGSFSEVLRVFLIFGRKKSVKIPLITANAVKKRKKIIKKVLQIYNIFVIINAVELYIIF